MYYDTHTHLNDDKLYASRKSYFHNFTAQGGAGLVNVGVDHEHNVRAIEIARAAEDEKSDCRMKATIGYHPSEVCFGNVTKENIDDKMSALKELYTDNKEYIIAIGECGIDTHYPDGSAQIGLQKELFRRQCDVAKELDLPVVIHSRDDFASTLEVLQPYTDLKIYFHCYGYGPDEIAVLRASFPRLRIGFCGNITYPKAQPLRDALLACDIGSIVCETDAPYLSPQKVRGETNEPAHVRLIYEYISGLRGKSLEETVGIVTHNVQALYNITP